MEEKINACQTLAELGELERTHLLNEEEQRLVFERRLQIFQRIHEWREENERFGLEPTNLRFLDTRTTRAVFTRLARRRSS